MMFVYWKAIKCSIYLSIYLYVQFSLQLYPFYAESAHVICNAKVCHVSRHVTNAAN